MKETPLIRQGLRGFFFSVIWIVLAVGAMTLAAQFPYPDSHTCGEMVGAGFPVLFICDEWGGGSPTGSWGKIDFVDVLNGGVVPGGFLVDFLFYVSLIGIIVFTLSRIIRREASRSDLWWTAFIGAGFVTGILCAFLVFLSSYAVQTRPPRIPTPTPTPSLSATVDNLSTVAPSLTPAASPNP